MATYFLSDLHLEEDRPDITAALLQFLDKETADADAIYILGDLFERSIGDDYITPLNTAVINALRACANRQIALFFMVGNRDFLVGTDFCNQSGCQLLSDPYRIELAGRPVLLSHGDALCTDDTAYQTFRQHIRNPHTIQQLLAKSIDERLQIARSFRDASASESQKKTQDIMDVNQQAVEHLLRNQQVYTLIHGHTHRPNTHRFTVDSQAAERWVLSDWDKELYVLRHDSHATANNHFSVIKRPL